MTRGRETLCDECDDWSIAPGSFSMSWKVVGDTGTVVKAVHNGLPVPARPHKSVEKDERSSLSFF
jgi:hypothetical protein